MEMETEKEGFIKSTLRRIWWTYLVIGGMAVGFYVATIQMQNEAIQHDAAHYDSKTGYWDWNTEDQNERQKAIDESCKALGSKAKNDPQCILMGVGK